MKLCTMGEHDTRGLFFSWFLCSKWPFDPQLVFFSGWREITLETVYHFRPEKSARTEILQVWQPTSSRRWLSPFGLYLWSAGGKCRRQPFKNCQHLVKWIAWWQKTKQASFLWASFRHIAMRKWLPVAWALSAPCCRRWWWTLNRQFPVFCDINLCLSLHLSWKKKLTVTYHFCCNFIRYWFCLLCSPLYLQRKNKF